MGELMDLEITDLLKLDLDTQGSTMKRYGKILVDVNFNSTNTRRSIIKYKTQNFIIAMKDGKVTKVTKADIPKETFQ